MAINHATTTPVARILHAAYKNRGLLVSFPLLLAIFFAWHECENELLIWTSASIWFGLGLFIRIWAQQHLRFRIPHKALLTRTGPYELVRNPIYIGNTMICVGLVIASELIWLVPITLLICAAAYTLVVRHEERYLSRKYGEPYREYMREVPRWYPRLQPGYSPGWITSYLKPSIRVEAYNLLFLIPFIVKELFL